MENKFTVTFGQLPQVTLIENMFQIKYVMIFVWIIHCLIFTLSVE